MSYLETENKSELDTEVAKKHREGRFCQQLRLTLFTGFYMLWSCHIEDDRYAVL